MTGYAQIKNFLEKGNILLVIVALFLAIVVPIVGLKTINTLMFELVPNTNKVKYSVCTEMDYGNQGSHCIEKDIRFTSFEKRIRDHFDESLFF